MKLISSKRNNAYTPAFGRFLNLKSLRSFGSVSLFGLLRFGSVSLFLFENFGSVSLFRQKYFGSVSLFDQDNREKKVLRCKVLL